MSKRASTEDESTEQLYCIRCGEPVVDRGKKGAYVCQPCTEKRRAREREKANLYFRARNAALKRLREEFPHRYDELMEEERERLLEQENAS